MDLYIAGNFEYMSNEAKEAELAELCLKSTGSYNRLASFFFRKETGVVINVVSNLKGIPTNGETSENCGTETSDQSPDACDEQEGSGAATIAPRLKRRQNVGI